MNVFALAFMMFTIGFITGLVFATACDDEYRKPPGRRYA